MIRKSIFIRLRRIPRLFKPWINAVKSRGAVRYFLEWRNIEQADSARVACRRITPTSVAKLSFHLSTSYLEKANEKRISPYLIPRNFLEISGTLPLKSLMRFLRASRGKPGTTPDLGGVGLHNLNLVFTHLIVFCQKLDKSFIGFSIHGRRVQMDLITLTFRRADISLCVGDDFNFNLHGMDNPESGFD